MAHTITQRLVRTGGGDGGRLMRTHVDPKNDFLWPVKL
jgi:hypothetical protein